MANASCREAEAVLDEVGLLETALHEAMQRKQNMLPQPPLSRQEVTPTATLGLDTNLDGRVDTYVTGIDKNRDGIPDVLQGRRNLLETPTTLDCARYGLGSVKPHERVDTATATYGVQLRSWINWQVDQRLDEVMQELIRKHVSQVHEESGLSLGLAKRAEAESERNKETLAKLFAVVDGISQELERLNARTNESASIIDLCHIAIEKLKDGRLEEAEIRGELEDLRRQIEPLEKEVTPGLLLAVQRDIRELARRTEDVENRFDASLNALHGEVHEKVAEESRNLESLRQTNMLQQRELQDLEMRFGSLGENFNAFSARCDTAALNRQIEDWLNEFRQDIETYNRKLVADLRAETTAAFRSQSVSFAALDEQLWLTDQRLGQRIDEVSHATKPAMYSFQCAPREHERSVASSSRAISRDGSRSCLSDADDKVKVDVQVAQISNSPNQYRSKRLPEAPSFQDRSRRLPEAPSLQESNSSKFASPSDRSETLQNGGLLTRNYLSSNPEKESKIDRQASGEEPDTRIRGRLRFGATTNASDNDSSLGGRRLIVTRPASSTREKSNEVSVGIRCGEGLQLSSDEPAQNLGRSSSLRSLRSLR